MARIFPMSLPRIKFENLNLNLILTQINTRIITSKSNKNNAFNYEINNRQNPVCLFTSQRSYKRSFCFGVMSHNNDHGPTTPQDSFKTVRCVIKGRVQGVFYRNWTIENATQMGLQGWVRNRRDGSVEALFSGRTEGVDEMLQRCRRGPPDAMVTAFQAYPCNEDPGSGFQRKPTV